MFFLVYSIVKSKFFNIFPAKFVFTVNYILIISMLMFLKSPSSYQQTC